MFEAFAEAVARRFGKGLGYNSSVKGGVMG